MLAAEFIARDRAGFILAGQDEDGEMEWMSGDYHEYDFLMSYFGENGHFPKDVEDFAPYND